MNSYTWRSAVIRSDLPPTTRHVLLTLSCHINDAGEPTYPSTLLLSDECGLSERAVVTHLKSAAALGWLTVSKHGYAGKAWARNQYRPRVPDGFVPRPAPIRKGTEPASVPYDKKLSTEALNDVQHLNGEGTEPASVPSHKALNVTTEGTEPDDRKALNDVQSNYPQELPKELPMTAQPHEIVDNSFGKLNKGVGGVSARPGHITNPTTGEVNPRPVQIAVLLRKTYSMPVTSNSAEVLEMTRLAVTDLEIAEHIDAFRVKKPGEQPNARYVLRMIESTRKAVADADAAPGVSGAAAIEIGVWWRSASGIEAKGVELGVKRRSGEPEWVFKTRVFRDAGPGKWRDEWEAALLKSKNSAYAQVFEQFHGHPPVEVQA